MPEPEDFIPEESLRAIERGEAVERVPCYTCVANIQGERLLLIGLDGPCWAVALAALRASPRDEARALAEGILHAIVSMANTDDEPDA